jgi:hypothetical protein
VTPCESDWVLSIRAAIHAASGVPRIFSAALRAGASPAQAAQVVAISAGATRVATQRGRGVPGRQNAMRHFVWQALLTARHGVDLARAIAEAQEVGTPDRRDSGVDRRNNATGQAYGAAHAVDLAGLPTREALDRLAGVALQKWASGELVWVTAR